MKISEKTIRNEAVMANIWRFEEWLKKVRLNSEERSEIEAIISALKEMIDY